MLPSLTPLCVMYILTRLLYSLTILMHFLSTLKSNTTAGFTLTDLINILVVCFMNSCWYFIGECWIPLVMVRMAWHSLSATCMRRADTIEQVLTKTSKVRSSVELRLWRRWGFRLALAGLEATARKTHNKGN